MANTTPYLQEQLLNSILRAIPYPSPKQVYLGLFVESSGQQNGLAEVQLQDYKRQAITFHAPNDGKVDNLAEIRFGPALTDWGRIMALGIFDVLKGGNTLLISPLKKGLTVEEGSTLIFEANKVTIALT